MDEQNEDLDNLCPLCMEEMDVTDRHLRPCQCGYQICVWCWHQIMELATKDHTEGRCPACRTQYDKDKVVGTRLNCEELMDLAVDKKKLHKSKAKAQEGRKHLSNVRVVQRNLVYVVGFPSNLADEETLERREFFGQYGKILKVAVSRSGQHSHNGPSASVYVTFVKEEDAVRCIKVVDGCIFEGKLLRACFGTNKYCNAWLKNMSCNNPDCLYLHDEGPDEDSYTKEEMLAKYGSKSQYFHDLTKPPHRAVGVGLPPPVFEASTSSTPAVTTQSQNVSASSNRNSAAKVTASPGGPGKLTSLPAAASWGLRGTPVKASVTKPGGSRKKIYGSMVPAASSKPLTSVSCHSAKEFEEEEISTASSYVTNVSDRVLGEDYTSTSLSDRYNMELKGEDQIDPSEESSSPENDGFRSATSSDVQYTRILNLSGGSQPDHDSYKQAEGSIQCPSWLGSDRSESAGMASPERLLRSGASIFSTDERTSCDRTLSLNVGEVSISLISNSSEHSDAHCEPNHAPCSEASSSESMKKSVDVDSYPDDVMRALERIDLEGRESLTEVGASRIPSSSHADARTGKPGENNIIADILTMDFSTDGELSPGDLTKYFLTGKATDSKPSENYSSHGKQSRFSFARQDNASSTVGGIEPTVSSRSFSKLMSEEQHAVSFNNSLDEASHFASRNSLPKSSSFQSAGSELFGQSSASKSRLLAPPGFAGTCSVPPPGFSVRNVNNTPQSPAGTRPYDFELIDPAIMAVGRGAIQNELPNRTMRNQPKPDIRQLFPSSNVDDILGLGLISQQQSGVLDFDSMLKQQQQHQQQQRLSMNDPRKVPFKYPVAASDNLSSLVHGESGSLARMSGQYEDGYVSPYAAAAARSYRSLSSLDSSWLGYGADAFASEGLPKLKSSLRGTTAGLGNSGFSGSIRQGDGKSMFLSNGNQSMPTMDHYMAEQSFREADIQGAFV